MHNQTISSKQAGFTIVEIIVSMTLFALAVTFIMTTVQYVQYSSRDARYVDLAHHAAKSQIEVLRRGDFDALVTGSTINFSSSPLLEGMPSGTTASVVVSVPSEAPQSKRLDVSVTYPLGSTTKTIRLAALIPRHEEGL